MLIGTAIALAVSRGRHHPHPHLRPDARVHAGRQPGAAAPRGDRGALPRHGHDDVLYEGEPGSTKSLPVLQHMAALQAELERDPLVVRTASVADLVKTLHKTFNADDPDPLPPARHPGADVAAALPRRLAGVRALHRPLAVAVGGDGLPAQRRLGAASARSSATCSSGWRPIRRRSGEQVLIAGGVGPTVLAVNEHTTYGKLLNMLVVLSVIYLVSSLIMRSPRSGSTSSRRSWSP